MTREECERAAGAALGLLDEDTRRALAGVSLIVLDRPADGWPADARGVFEGVQGVSDDDPEVDDGTEDPCLPSGAVYLVAGNLPDDEAVTVTLLHEIGHALGFDELDVALLGLSERGVLDADAHDANRG